MSERFTVQVDIEARDRTTGALTGVKKGFREAFSQVITGALRNAGDSAMGFVRQLPAMAVELTKLGIAAEATENRFTQFAGGARQAANYLAAFQQGTQNTVDRMSAMQSASKLLQMGLVGTADEMSSVAAIATKLGDQTMNAGDRIADFAALLANQSIPRLDNFGISSGRVRARIDELLRSGQALDRESAFKMAVMEEGAKALAILGDTSDTTAQKIATLQAAVQDAKLGFAEMAVSVLEATGSVDGLAARIRMLPDTLMRIVILQQAWRNAQAEFLTGGLFSGAWDEFINTIKRGEIAMSDVAHVSEVQRYAHLQNAGAIKEAEQATESYSVTLARQAGMSDFNSVAMERMATAAAAQVEALKAQQEAAEEAALAQTGLAGSLKDATDAQIAQTAVMQLGMALQEGTITLDQYTTAVTETQLAFGLADEQSIFLTESLGKLTGALADGTLEASGYDEALKAVIQQSQSAGVEVGVFNNALDALPKRVDVEIVTTYRTVGRPPSGVGEAPTPGNIPEGMQFGSAFARGGWALVGERGPELAMIPRGSAVLPADQSRHVTNNFNLAVNSQQSAMSVANEFELMKGLVG